MYEIKELGDSLERSSMGLEKSEELDNLYKLFGVCAHHCSNIEYRIAFLLQPAKWKKHRAHLDCKIHEMQQGGIEEWAIASKNLDEALENVGQEIDGLYNVSLGNLVKQVNDNYPLTDDQSKYLKEILDNRNYVIHKMWGKYGTRLKDPLVIKEMLGELQEYERYFRSASNWLQQQAK